MDRPSQSLLLDISAGGIVRHLRYVLRDSPGYRLSMTSLPTRKIGPYTVSTINYGHPPDRNTATKLLNRALDLGITMLDTAAIYGDGDNERLFASAINHRRKEFLLASKGVLHSVDGKRTLDGLPKAISETLDASLSRLCTDHIDLYYLHRLDRLVPIEESVGAVVRAIEAGKVGAIGLSEMSAGTIRRAHAVHPIAAIQSEYSPMVLKPVGSLALVLSPSRQRREACLRVRLLTTDMTLATSETPCPDLLAIISNITWLWHISSLHLPMRTALHQRSFHWLGSSAAPTMSYPYLGQRIPAI
jgi:Aldo/keto reductase family